MTSQGPQTGVGDTTVQIKVLINWMAWLSTSSSQK